MCESKSVNRRNSFIAVRIAAALVLAVPGTLVAPFAIWLIVVSTLQFIYHPWFVVSLLVILICIIALIALGFVWGFVILGVSEAEKRE